MKTGLNPTRLLGIAQLLVFAGAILSERLFLSAVGSGSIAQMMVNIQQKLIQVRVSSVIALVESVLIIFLGVMFFIVFHEEYKTVSLLALALFLAEGITLAFSKIGAFGLITLSQDAFETGSQATALQALGNYLFYGVDRLGYDIHMFFFSLGGILWYTLLSITDYIPKPISIWGLVSVILIAITVVLKLYDRDFLPAAQCLALPYAPFELVLGVLLIVKGGG